MSRNGTARLNPRRDANEPALRAYAERLGYVVMQVSGKGLPDWVLMGGWRTWLVDVKTKDGHFKPAQVDQWTDWEEKGISVYIVRKTADIDALLRGELLPWKPGDAAPKRKPKAHKPGVSKARAAADLCHTDFCPTSRVFGSRHCTKHGPHPAAAHDDGPRRCPDGFKDCDGGEDCCHPPQAKRSDASTLAAETFAPPSCNCMGYHVIGCIQGARPA